MSVDALMVALEATFTADRAHEVLATDELRLGEERFTIEIDRGTIAIARGRPLKREAVIDTDAATLRAVVFGGRKLAGAPIGLPGDQRLARKFFRLFARPTRTR